MEEGAILLFMFFLVLFVSATVIVLYQMNEIPQPVPQTSSGFPLPDSTMIGAQCPVGCTCFPNPDATMASDMPTQICAMLNNGVMYKCPAQCCQPTCINQAFQGIAPRVSQ